MSGTIGDAFRERFSRFLVIREERLSLAVGADIDHTIDSFTLYRLAILRATTSLSLHGAGAQRNINATTITRKKRTMKAQPTNATSLRVSLCLSVSNSRQQSWHLLSLVKASRGPAHACFPQKSFPQPAQLTTPKLTHPDFA